MNELKQFEKLVVQNLYIRYLNKAVDHHEWESEKKDAIIELKDKEIEQLKEQITRLTQSREQVEANFKSYIKKVKAAKVNESKTERQQEIITGLRRDLDEEKKRLSVCKKMNQLLLRQSNGKEKM